MSRYPSQGYPPPFPPQQYYSNPDHPIPYRGLSQGDPRSPTSNISQATSKQEEENDKNAEDGGWGRDGPLIIERKTKKRGHKGMNSHDKTAIWLKTSQSGPSAVVPEQPTAPVPAQETSTPKSPIPKASKARKSKSKPPAEVAAPVAEVAAEVIDVKEEGVVQNQDNVPIPVGPVGWPIDLESATTSPGEESQEPSLSTSIKSEAASTVESQSEEEPPNPASDPTPVEPSASISQVDDDPTPPSSQVPTTLPPPVSQGYVYLQPPPRGLQPPWHDPNVLDVVNPRRWGAGQVAVSEAALVNNRQVGGDNTEQAWAADGNLAEWRQQVSRQSHSQSEGPPESSASTSEVDEIPDRPDSVPPVPPPVTAYISSESSATSRASTPKAPPLEDDGNTTPPLVRDSPSPTLEDTLPTPTGPSGRRPSISHVEVDGQVIRSPPRTPRPPRRQGPGSGGSWWKREPHPAYSAEFEARRLLVIFPFPIRIDRIKPIMSDHFSKYGSIRAIQPREMANEAATKAVVVFWSVESVENCLADPDRFDCISRSYPTSSRFNIHIEPLPSQTSTIYIKMTGPRCDHRARSASPPNRQGPVVEQYEDTRPMPPFITVWGVPELHRWNGRVDWRAHIIMGEEPAQMEWRQAVHETGNEPTLIERIELSRRNPQKSIIPKLCDFFAEIVEIVPPKTTHHGWLITISGQRDGQRLMDQIGQIPGITTRWALASDSQDIPSTFPVQNQTQTRRRSRASPPQRQRTISQNSRPPTVHTTQSVVDPNEPAPISPLSARSLPSEYAGLTKTLAPTYRGRLLKEERSDGGSRFVDECAIFVGRLVKGVETEFTLLDRFAKYGRICGIEYNPLNNRNTYATARILYGDRASADRALLHEGRAVSHGSGLKIEMRRVLPQDVDMREMYIDEFGRPVSPSMASQYSPPHEHMVPSWPLPPVLPYPSNTAPLSPPYGNENGAYPHPPPSGQYMPHPNFFPVYFGHPGPMGAPPPSPMAADGNGNVMGSQPGMWYQPPIGSSIPPFAHHQGQNVGYVPIYPTLPFQAQGPAIVTSFTEEVTPQVQAEAQQPPTGPEPRQRSPSLPSAPLQTSLQAEINIQGSGSSGSGSTTGSGLKAVSLREENGVLKAEYDPEELRRYQEEKGYTTAHVEPHPSQQAQRVEPEIPRPQSSPGFEPRQSEFGSANEYIAFARRGSLATAHTINPRTQEVLTPVPIPLFDHNTQEPYSPPHPHGQVQYPPPHTQASRHFEYGPVGQRPGPNRYRNRGDGGNHYSGHPQQHGQGSEERPWVGRGW